MEFAFVVPLLFTLLLGVVEFGVTLNDAQSLRGGTSTAARNAAVLDSPEGTCSSQPAAPNVAVRNIVCDAKTRIGLDGVRVRVHLPDGWVKGASLVLCTARQADSLTGLFPFLNDRVVTTRAEYRIERVGTVTPVEFAETAPSGGDWDFCEDPA